MSAEKTPDRRNRGSQEEARATELSAVQHNAPVVSVNRSEERAPESVTDTVSPPSKRAETRNARLATLTAGTKTETADLMWRAADGDTHAAQSVSLAAMSGMTDRRKAERQFRNHSRETAEWCVYCGRNLDSRETVWWDGAPYGRCCRPTWEEKVWDRDLRDHRWVDAFRPEPAPCEGCGRPVHVRVGKYADDPIRRHVVCCERCRIRALADRRRADRVAARSGRTCEVCGGTFNAPRSDARYCSGACRQKAYRARAGCDPTGSNIGGAL